MDMTVELTVGMSCFLLQSKAPDLICFCNYVMITRLVCMQPLH